MEIIATILHFAAIALAIGLSTIGIGIGQGRAVRTASQELLRHNLGHNQISRSLILGLMLVESGGILAFVIALLLMLTPSASPSFDSGLAEIGIGLSIGLAACFVGLASARTIQAATMSIARQPFFAQKIITLMLVIQSIIEAPVIFSFIMCLLIKTQLGSQLALFDGVRLFAVALAIGLGSVGPSIGQFIFSYAACKALSLNKEAYGKLFSFTLLSEAVIETPLIFSLVISMLIFLKSLSYTHAITTCAGLLISAIAVSVGAGGASIGTGFVASKSCDSIALYPERYGLLVRSTLFAQVIIESCGIYALIIALLLVMRT